MTTTAFRTTPVQARSLNRIQQISAAAETAITEIGIERFTTADVARIADISIGTVYRYFEDRVAILDHLRPDRHTALTEANNTVRALAEYLESTRDAIYAGGEKVVTSMDCLVIVEHALKILEG